MAPDLLNSVPDFEIETVVPTPSFSFVSLGRLSLNEKSSHLLSSDFPD